MASNPLVTQNKVATNKVKDKAIMTRTDGTTASSAKLKGRRILIGSCC